SLTLYKLRYVIVHFDSYPTEVARAMRQRIAQQARCLRIVKEFPNVWVVALDGEELPEPAAQPGAGNLSDLPCFGWRAAASRNGAGTALAFDRNFETFWTTASSQRKGDFFELQLPKTVRISRIDLYFKHQVEFVDYPRDLHVEVSDDGKTWREAPLQFAYYRLLKALLDDPKTDRMTVDIEPVLTRFVRLSIAYDALAPPWTISEIFVFEQIPLTAD
ncbi:MAG: discoidin domain-containing protein, partial [bacterium]